MIRTFFHRFYFLLFIYKRLPTHFTLYISYTKTNRLANSFTFYLLCIIVETSNVAQGKHFKLGLIYVG